jgi:pyruvate dehydrogenase E2 component (dihydrolipoamide acetyltransferase)
MSKEIKLPLLGEHLEGGKVLEVKVAPGDTVSKGQPLLEVEAEKASVDIPAPAAGKITEVRVKQGEEVTFGQTLALLEPADGVRTDGSGAKTKSAAPAKETAPKQEPATKGKPQAKDEPTAKEEPAAGEESEATEEPSATKEDTAEEEEITAKPQIAEKEEPKAKEAPPARQRPGGDGKAASDGSPKDEPVPAGPATRRLARELGVNLRQVHGSGSGGRIVSEDVKAFVRQMAAGTAKGAPALPDFERWGPVEYRPLEQVRRRTAEHVSLAWSQIPHVTQHDQCDITELDAFRRQQEGEGKGPKLTVTAFAIKAAAIALREFPRFNSSIDLANGQLIVKKYINIGIAVDTDRGLLVPVLRDADHKSIATLAQELAELADKARQKKLSADDMRGGSFTITNLGGIGGSAFTPIINYPEVAILGLSRAKLQPVVRDGQVVPRLVMTVSLSYDHRVIDGADGARFTRRICDMLEHPLKMLVQA